ncbi:hypothetical protein D9615_010543 [Tricholomella constricta]|uniref:valine--tRNA ligase n=1 Tax=Tricholomella constricta TaxID=117010 RepID=A0A8H5GL07_9AGAR|nr:hypothetical protein D9615_010543 [Tricholomella constricta]
MGWNNQPRVAPPNVTGGLHFGYGLTVAVPDSLVRWCHAGISTQSVVGKRLYKTSGKTASINLSRAVTETFCKLHEDGIIYRAIRLVNWYVKLNTTLSNLEVEQKELTDRTFLPVPGYDPKEKFEFGVITSFAYVIEGSDERIVVAAIRPETMLGDAAIAVHPDDPSLPLSRAPPPDPQGRRRRRHGAGAVKITPAHDPNDYEVGVRHNLEVVNTLDVQCEYGALEVEEVPC